MTLFGADAAVIVDCAAPFDRADPRALVIGIDHVGSCPAVDPGAFDILLTHRKHAPAPWVFAADPHLESGRLAARIATHPLAARTLVEVLRIQSGLAFETALAVESLAYSTLLGGGDFANWAAMLPRSDEAASASPLRVVRDGNILTLVLSDPGTRNAISARMRDAMFDILTNAIEDPSAPDVAIVANGKCFSTGGHLPEFGSNRDLAQAHAIRVERSCASLLHRLGARAMVTFHGAVIGSGLEIFAAAGHRMARRGAWFQLPELAMGLIPGAGGTVTVSRAIGRHRAGWLMLSGRRIDARTARNWGLVQAIVP